MITKRNIARGMMATGSLVYLLGIWRTWGGRWNKKEGPEMKRRLTKLTAAGLAVLALTGCTGGVPEEVSEEPPVPKNVETTWTLVVGQPEGSTCWDAAESFAVWSR